MSLFNFILHSQKWFLLLEIRFNNATHISPNYLKALILESEFKMRPGSFFYVHIGKEKIQLRAIIFILVGFWGDNLEQREIMANFSSFFG